MDLSPVEKQKQTVRASVYRVGPRPPQRVPEPAPRRQPLEEHEQRSYRRLLPWKRASRAIDGDAEVSRRSPLGGADGVEGELFLGVRCIAFGRSNKRLLSLE